MLAVAHELKRIQPDVDLIYAIGKGDKLAHLPKEHPDITKVCAVRSGKFRRYHGAGWKQLLDVKTLLKNIRDFFYVAIGIVQALLLLRKEKPDIIFIKGGYVAVPIGLAAAVLKIPYITHDSDVVPGLANRIIARWAQMHTVAMPVENYTYEKAKMQRVGVPISKNYSKVSRTDQKKFMRDIGITESDAQVALVTGGGLGAERLNVAITRIAKALLTKNPSLFLVHITGPNKETAIRNEYDKRLNPIDKNRIILKSFSDDLYKYSGAADVIIARAGANSLAEFAAQQKACIIIPNPELTGGHQLKNAASLASMGAIMQLEDAALQKNPELLLRDIEFLLHSVKERAKIATQLYKLADNESAAKLAKLLLNTVKRD